MKGVKPAASPKPSARSGSRRSRPSGTPLPAGEPPTAGKPRGSALKQREAARRALAAEAAARATRRRRWVTVLAPVGVVIVFLAGLIGVRAATSSNHSGKKSGDAAAAVVAQVTGVPATAFDAVGAGIYDRARLTPVTGAPLTSGGHPRVLYVGAEYCPFCAAERWSLIVALARFGTWHGLRYGYSGAPPEAFPNTPTFTFHGATYTSRWISFTGVETASNQELNGSWAPLDRLRPADEAVMRTHDSQGSIPYTNLAGRFVIVGATYDPGVIHGKTHAQIAGSLAAPGSTAARAIDGGANAITAALCRETGGQPGAVCSSPGVVAAGKTLP